MSMLRLQSFSAEVPTDRPIGLLAGWGKFPFAVAGALRDAGHRVAGVGIVDHADPRLGGALRPF